MERKGKKLKVKEMKKIRGGKEKRKEGRAEKRNVEERKQGDQGCGEKELREANEEKRKQ